MKGKKWTQYDFDEFRLSLVRDFRPSLFRNRIGFDADFRHLGRRGFRAW